ncbi:MAG: phosphoenolpyruvate--protein phosphotransferase [Proteobacteria bacterium]|nr:phosphoenolpyruvate--protein phosphotransferase [Pseudomonadota bacterium]
MAEELRRSRAGPVRSRRLLRHVRDVMAGPGSGQSRLNEVVRTIAADMEVEVCSVYVMRPGDLLELFATEGLRPTAVRRTRLRVGEGVVGTIAAEARPYNLPEAALHPSFASRPETGEEAYHSMLGVPILRGGVVIGVLAVQSRQRRIYPAAEVEALQTAAMVLAELVAGGELVSRDEFRPTAASPLRPERYDGLALSPGLAMGAAVLHQRRLGIREMVAEDPEAELERLNEAVTRMHRALDDLLVSADLGTSGAPRDVLETFRMFAEDTGWLDRIAEAIRSGFTAEAAVQKVHEDMRARLAQVSDPYLRERLHDFDDLANRLLRHLSGEHGPTVRADLPEQFILVAGNLGPVELLDYDRGNLKGVVLEEGSTTAHATILARALDIPVVGRVHNVLANVEPGDRVIVDGDRSQVFIRPADEVAESFEQALKARADRRAAYAAMRDLPAETRDGARVALYLNAGLSVDLAALAETGAEGVGLYRTEIPFMARSAYPGVDDQAEIYREILDAAGEKPVLFRTLDIGSDKSLPYWGLRGEENPAMGWRAIRVSLDRPLMLRQQFRALVRAAAGRPLSVMFPMVAHVSEFIAARRLLWREVERERAAGVPVPEPLRAGVMFEVPALAWQLPELLARADFVSVGTNDLLQFLYASDRSNPSVADRYDPLSPPVLALLRSVVEHCAAARVPLSLCGEAAGRPIEAMALIGIGFRSISMPAPGIGPVKTMIRSLELGPLEQYLKTLYNLPDHSLRERIRAFAVDHGVTI